MDRITDTAYSFIDSVWVRDRLKATELTFSPVQALSLVFNSNRPQMERFPAMLEILAGITAPAAEELAALLNEVFILTDPVVNRHFRFIERYNAEHRVYLTAAQLIASIRRDPRRAEWFSVISRGKRVGPVMFVNRNGVTDIECSPSVRKLLSCCPVSGVTAIRDLFTAGEVVRNIVSGTRWVVINSDISALDGRCDSFDFSAMVVPFEYREHASPELIRKHFSEHPEDVIAEHHEHIYLPFLEPDRE